jgi:hypothetical protein
LSYGPKELLRLEVTESEASVEVAPLERSAYESTRQL